MRLIESDSLSNQNIATALEVGSYTAAAALEIYAMIWATQIAGNGDYVAFLTINRAGAGTIYRVVPITTAAVASGVTSICLTTIAVPVRSGDVVKAFLTGLAGDTTTPDTVVDWFEADYLRPTTAGQHNVDVDVSGGVEVGSIQAGAITAAAIATDAIDADAIKADAVTEIQAGLATAADQTAIKAKTDQLAFVGGKTDANVGAISGDTTAADNAAAYFNGAMLGGTVSQAGLTNSFLTSLGGGVYEDTTFYDQVIYFHSGDNEGTEWRIVTFIGSNGRITIDGELVNPTQVGDIFYILPGYQGVNVEAVNTSTAAADLLETNIPNLDVAVSSVGGGSGATAAEVWTYSAGDRALSTAGNLAIWNVLTSGLTTVGSIGKAIVDFITATTTSLSSIISSITGLSGATLTINSPVLGNAVTVYVGDTWTYTQGGLGDLTPYEVIALTVKGSESDSDSEAALYLRSDTGLVAINGMTTGVTAGDGSLTVGVGEIMPRVAMSATAGVTMTGGFTWWLKGLDTSATPDGGTTIATGTFKIKAAGVRAII